MGLTDIHVILFNAYIMYVFALGVWAAISAGRGRGLTGDFWGAMAIGSILAFIVLVVGILMALQGLRPADERFELYFLYMIFLVVIMPGLFSMLHGRDDRNAALAFAMLAFFNGAVGISMAQRVLISGWV